MSHPAKLMFLCGKMAAGKSTLARDLAQRSEAILLVQDELLEGLFPGEIADVADFLDRSSRLRNALAPYICAGLVEGYYDRSRLSRQHEGAACLVPGNISARECHS